MVIPDKEVALIQQARSSALMYQASDNEIMQNEFKELIAILEPMHKKLQVYYQKWGGLVCGGLIDIL